MLAQARAYQLKTKIEVLTKYSEGKPKCRMCGECNIKFLGLDHLNGSGKVHKRAIGGAGGYVYLWARKNNYPPMFQVLCHNCNFKKSFDRFPSSFKVRALSKYSNDVPKCAMCNETDLRTLTLDHINDDGAEDRRKLGIKSSNEFYRLLLRSPLRSDLQVLCQNHNLGKRCLG
jgi:hypothetical protein